MKSKKKNAESFTTGEKVVMAASGLVILGCIGAAVWVMQRDNTTPRYYSSDLPKIDRGEDKNQDWIDALMATLLVADKLT